MTHKSSYVIGRDGLRFGVQHFDGAPGLSVGISVSATNGGHMMGMTPSEARNFAAEIVRVADEAEDGASFKLLDRMFRNSIFNPRRVPPPPGKEAAE